MGKAESANRARSYGSGRSPRGKRCHSVTSPSRKALTFPETPQLGKPPFPKPLREEGGSPGGISPLLVNSS